MLPSKCTVKLYNLITRSKISLPRIQLLPSGRSSAVISITMAGAGIHNFYEIFFWIFSNLKGGFLQSFRSLAQFFNETIIKNQGRSSYENYREYNTSSLNFLSFVSGRSCRRHRQNTKFSIFLSEL